MNYHPLQGVSQHHVRRWADVFMESFYQTANRHDKNIFRSKMITHHFSLQLLMGQLYISNIFTQFQCLQFWFFNHSSCFQWIVSADWAPCQFSRGVSPFNQSLWLRRRKKKRWHSLSDIFYFGCHGNAFWWKVAMQTFHRFLLHDYQEHNQSSKIDSPTWNVTYRRSQL